MIELRCQIQRPVYPVYFRTYYLSYLFFFFSFLLFLCFSFSPSVISRNHHRHIWKFPAKSIFHAALIWMLPIHLPQASWDRVPEFRMASVVSDAWRLTSMSTFANIFIITFSRYQQLHAGKMRQWINNFLFRHENLRVLRQYTSTVDPWSLTN